MPPDTSDRHFLPAAFGDRMLKVLLIGCGGNGAQMLMGLASLDTALRAISSRSLHVTVVDDDIVTEANLGRQPFFRCDLGNPKARTLTERINLAHGLAADDEHAVTHAAGDCHHAELDGGCAGSRTVLDGFRHCRADIQRVYNCARRAADAVYHARAHCGARGWCAALGCAQGSCRWAGYCTRQSPGKCR